MKLEGSEEPISILYDKKKETGKNCDGFTIPGTKNPPITYNKELNFKITTDTQ
jgi:hypothetical protein